MAESDHYVHQQELGCELLLLLLRESGTTQAF